MNTWDEVGSGDGICISWVQSDLWTSAFFRHWCTQTPTCFSTCSSPPTMLFLPAEGSIFIRGACHSFSLRRRKTLRDGTPLVVYTSLGIILLSRKASIARWWRGLDSSCEQVTGDPDGCIQYDWTSLEARSIPLSLLLAPVFEGYLACRALKRCDAASWREQHFPTRCGQLKGACAGSMPRRSMTTAICNSGVPRASPDRRHL